MIDAAFWKDKRVFVTGHTGFKGSWLCFLLNELGAQVTGYAMEPPTDPSLFTLCGVEKAMISIIGDVRNLNSLRKAIEESQPEFLIHMAAQPIVRTSYKDPVGTYSTNVMGTVNLLECARTVSCIRSILNVTTDKVYENKEWAWGYRENEVLDGYDPYSNSKSCSELVTRSYVRAFFSEMGIPVSTARAGNVIGGGDFADDRIFPDCIRAAMKGQPIIVRNPYSTRPYQHVLDPLTAYLLILQRQYEDGALAGEYNIGPDDVGCVETGTLVDLICREWPAPLTWENKHDGGPHEAGFLKLDNTKAKRMLGWQPRWGIGEAVQKSVNWYWAYAQGGDIAAVMREQIAEAIGHKERDDV